jgi:hypothetical protein
MAKPIGTLGTIDTLTIGGRVFTDLSTLIILNAGTNTIAVRYSTFRLATATSGGYAVTAAKTFTFHAIRGFYNENVAGNIASVQLGSHSASIGFDSATVIDTHHTGDTSFRDINLINPIEGQPFYEHANIGFAVAAGVYPAMKVSATSGGYVSVTAYGYEA